ncbi:hypothetical protein DFJ43DRAFT_864649 [Lentinula guzmanii]|uniref:Uncharacterized protein n=1 Tax=Lentinula guzmanii TaxID=2804957 RepID=A0AA38N461_9AGAR|nr:hypothetical protein DFJ43DRAFT_864649 [Lentinula guzmanii]
MNGDGPTLPHVNGINGNTRPTLPHVNGINGNTRPTLPHVNGINGINGNPRLTPPRVNDINDINDDTHPTYEIWFSPSQPRPATRGSHHVPVDTAGNVSRRIRELEHAYNFRVNFLEAQPASALGFWYQATATMALILISLPLFDNKYTRETESYSSHSHTLFWYKMFTAVCTHIQMRTRQQKT